MFAIEITISDNIFNIYLQNRFHKIALIHRQSGSYVGSYKNNNLNNIYND